MRIARLQPCCSPPSRSGLRDRLEAARDQLRRHAEAGGASARSTQARADRRAAEAAASAGPAQAASRGSDRHAREPPIRTRASTRQMAPPESSRRGPAISTPSRSIRSRTARSIRSTPRLARSRTSRSNRASSSSAPARSRRAIPCAGSSATPRAAPGRQAHPHSREADTRRSRHQSRHQHRSPDLSPRAALGRKDLHGVCLLGLRTGSAYRASPAECRQPTLRRRSPLASISTR